MDFESRLQKAIQRGRQERAEREQAEMNAMLTQRELKRLFSDYRLDLSERIEAALRQLADHFPGFRFETIVGEQGWGAAVGRDNLEFRGRSRKTFFSRLEMVVRPLSDSGVLELAAKATVRNREVFRRSHFQRLNEVDIRSFHDVLDLWVLEYAEAYASEN